MRRRKMPKVKIPKPPKLQLPERRELKEIYKKLITGNISARIAALHEALVWWDKAMVYLMAKHPIGKDSSKLKTLNKATKARNLGVGGSTEPEMEQGISMAIKLYDKLWGTDASIPSLENAYKRYEDRKDELEAKEAENRTRFQKVLEALEKVFNPFGLKFDIQKSEKLREVTVGDDDSIKIILSRRLAKELYRKLRSEGMLTVLFSELPTVIKASGLEKSADGDGNDVWEPNLVKMIENLPPALENVLAYCNEMPTRKVFRKFEGALEAEVHDKGKAAFPKAPKAPRAVSNGQPRPKLQRGGLKIGGRYTPGSAMATAYQVLEDEKVHPLSEVFKKLGTSNPMDRIKWLQKHGTRNGKWTVVIQGNTIQMTIH